MGEDAYYLVSDSPSIPLISEEAGLRVTQVEKEHYLRAEVDSNW